MMGGRFANLAMSYATPWEQSRMMKFFAEHVREPVRTVVVGIDMNWCSPTKPFPRFTPHPFPPWEYDDDPWNDYAHLLNTRALAHSVRELLILAHLVSPDLQDDGYYRFTPDDSRYDPSRVRANLYYGPWQRFESVSRSCRAARRRGSAARLDVSRPRVAQAGARRPSRADEKNPRLRAASREHPAQLRGMAEVHPLQGCRRRHREGGPEFERHRSDAADGDDPERSGLLGLVALPRRLRDRRSSGRSEAPSRRGTTPAPCSRCYGARNEPREKFLTYHDDVCVHFMNAWLDVHGVNVVRPCPVREETWAWSGRPRVHPDSGSFGPTFARRFAAASTCRNAQRRRPARP